MADNKSGRKCSAESVQLVAETMDNTEQRETTGCNPVFVNSFTYVGTLMMFVVILEIPSLPVLPFPINKSMLVSSDAHFANNKHIKILFIALWAFHFIRRTLEVLFVHRYKRRMPIIESVGAPVYYWFFAMWIAWSMRYESGYEQSFVVLVILGSVFYLVGEIGNAICHFQLRKFRHETRPSFISNTSRHVLPHGFLFEYVSCPHYFFEIVTWIGFFLATWTLAAALFLLATIVTLVFYARKKHQAYVQEFNGNDGNEIYPPNRKTLIPFIY